MKFVSIDGTLKRVAHTSGMTFAIGKEPTEVPVYDSETDTGVKGLQECVLAAGCIPFTAKAEKAPETVVETLPAGNEVPEGFRRGPGGRLFPVDK